MSCLLLRARPWLAFSLLAAHALACATQAEGPSITEPDPELDPQVDEDITAMHGGETGSMGARECAASSSCLEVAEARVDGLREPLVLNREIIGTECLARDENSSDNCCFHMPAVCLCYYGWDGDQTRDRGNAMILGNRADCDEYGRDQSCLVPASDFAGCDVEDASSCDAPCAELDAKVVAHSAQTFDAEVRSATCTDRGECRVVHRIEDRCYASFGYAVTVYDCALSDQEILADAYPEAPPSSCIADVCDGGAAVAVTLDAGSSD